MGYNKAKAEKKWKEWKNKEENLLRKLGMNEDKIDELYNYDKELFNSERSFLRRTIIDSDFIEYLSTSKIELPIDNMDDLLNQIDREELYQAMRKINEQTLKIIYLKIVGYSVKEIAQMMGISDYTVRYRLRKVRKKLKKFD
ncbi:RNA polymerase sigma factor [Thomasclavelia spiroformis]|jgi:RNA polymerase sigma factor (sigma-70 family)|uniref:RNA polymerase sigma factor n=1 Tax=Thomasclavelia spiroformis TaxID=29348 RepID=UPI00241EB972|nr:sigma-70 family RNA polymerase sigma factor [Thomasclavelia spiroformis]